MTDTREEALAQVLAQRERARSRSPVRRATTAAAGALLGVMAVPLTGVLPELGVPALLVALRLLAAEFDWAARCYAWIVWRWGQVKAWYRGRSAGVRALVVLALVGVAAVLIGLLIAGV